jgi:cell division protein ZapA
MLKSEEASSTVEILGESFRIRGGTPEEVGALARFVDGKLSEIRARNDGLPLRSLLILTSLNIAEDLFRERRERENLVRDVEVRSRKLRERLESQFGPPWGGEEGISGTPPSPA